MISVPENPLRIQKEMDFEEQSDPCRRHVAGARNRGSGRTHDWLEFPKLDDKNDFRLNSLD